jgi:biopolymer transport protein ExbB
LYLQEILAMSFAHRPRALTALALLAVAPLLAWPAQGAGTDTPALSAGPGTLAKTAVAPAGTSGPDPSVAVAERGAAAGTPAPTLTGAPPGGTASLATARTDATERTGGAGASPASTAAAKDATAQALTQASATDKATTPAPESGSTDKTVANPYGLEALWNGSDSVAKGTLVILLLMSAASWYVIFVKLYEQFRLGRHARAANRTFWNAGALPAAIDTLDKKSAFHFIASSSVDASERHQGLLGYIDLNAWVSMSLQRTIEHVQSRLQDGLSLLATVGSTAPFVGLFGTVWGIYHALTTIAIDGQASIDKVAGPVGESLIMPAIGLAVAVPAVLGYNLLVRRNRVALEGVRAFAADLHAVVLGGAAERRANVVPHTQHVPHAIHAVA